MARSVTKVLPPATSQPETTVEPHAVRRRAILKKYGPQIRQLYGNDPFTLVKALAAGAAHTALAAALHNAPIWCIMLAGWIIGGCFSNHLMAALHEIVHCLALRSPRWSRWMSFVVNAPLALPAAVSFKKYHNEHHSDQGVEGVDMDLPTKLEQRLVCSIPAKLVYVVGYMIWYCLRPLALNTYKPSVWDLYNWLVVLAFDAILVYMTSWRALLYLLSATILGGGLHPLAGHLLAEHLEFVDGQETYSYYGPANAWMYNVGYHNEHHDFPQIPGSRLPALKAIAPEYYNTLAYHTSYTWVLWRFITDPNVGPWSRVRRTEQQQGGLAAAMDVQMVARGRVQDVVGEPKKRV